VAEHTADSVTEILKEIVALRSDEVGEKELKETKDEIVRAFPARFATANQVAAQMAALAVYDLPDKELETFTRESRRSPPRTCARRRRSICTPTIWSWSWWATATASNLRCAESARWNCEISMAHRLDDLDARGPVTSFREIRASRLADETGTIAQAGRPGFALCYPTRTTWACRRWVFKASTAGCTPWPVHRGARLPSRRCG